MALSFTVTAQSAWTGEYFFDEDGGESVGGSKIYVVHSLRIIESRDGVLTGHLYSQGYQTSVDVFGTVKIIDDELQLLYERDGSDHTGKEFLKDEVLLRLKREKDRIVTNWESFIPLLESSQANGKTRFRVLKKDKELLRENY